MSKLKKTPQEVKAQSPWDWIIEQDQRDRRERSGYTQACELDRAGSYEQADQALRSAGIGEDVIADRRRHIDWRLGQGFPVIGSY